MNNQIYFVGPEGDPPPVGQSAIHHVDREVCITTLMDHQFGKAQFFIEFFADGEGQSPVSPTSGTVIPEMSPSGCSWFKSKVGTIDAAAVMPGSVEFDVPTFSGQADFGRVTLRDIAGADYFRAWFWRAA